MFFFLLLLLLLLELELESSLYNKSTYRANKNGIKILAGSGMRFIVKDFTENSSRKASFKTSLRSVGAVIK